MNSQKFLVCIHSLITSSHPRPLGGRHAAVIPALPDELDANGYPLNAAATHYYSERGELLELDKPGELRIIQVDSEEIQQAAQAKAARATGNANAASNGSSLNVNSGLPPMTSTIKPITFHQEYTMPPPGRDGERKSREKERRNSRASNHSYEEYNGNGHVSGNGGLTGPGGESRSMTRTRSHSRSHSQSHSQSHSHSPALSHRATSHSPLLHRIEQQRPGELGQVPSPSHPPPPSPVHALPPPTSVFSSRPYMPPPTRINGRERQGPNVQQPIQVMPQSPPPVPATFASIMNAYPAPPMGGSPRGPQISETPVEYVYPNGR